MFVYRGMRAATGGQRAVLYVAGAFNLAAAVSVVLLSRVAPQWLGLDPLSASQSLYVDLFALLVAAFGVAYGLGGWDLPRFWPYISMGAACKAGVALLALAYFVTGNTGPLVMSLATCDAVFAVVFIRLLRAQATG